MSLYTYAVQAAVTAAKTLSKAKMTGKTMIWMYTDRELLQYREKSPMFRPRLVSASLHLRVASASNTDSVWPKCPDKR